ncbi:MAG TPA: hypothetical protein VEV83_07985 [Parafilimonas sp.]|nr:hypothetical protein [Parafilimonas sp.]
MFHFKFLAHIVMYDPFADPEVKRKQERQSCQEEQETGYVFTQGDHHGTKIINLI